MTEEIRPPEIPEETPEQKSFIGRLIKFCLTNKLVIGLCVVAIFAAGVFYAPFDWDLGFIERDPVPVDAIPDIGENQQIVFTQWMGRSPQDMEDQVSYPLTVAMLGIPGVKTIRSFSMFGFSSIYIIFNEDVEFYWSRSRVLEKLNSLPAGTLPMGVKPALGPDATALGQVYWYTLEGLDPDGKPAGGWDQEELRTIQDWYVRYWLLSADGVAEVGSVGGYVREYQIDVDPDAMRAYGVTLEQVFKAVKASNIDVGAKMIEVNRVEYLIRGIGFIRKVSDIEESVIAVRENVPVLVKNVAKVTMGPALRRGALDKGGAQAVGGVVVARYGDNPLRVIKNVKKKIESTKGALPVKPVIDYSKINRAGVAEYATAHGFEAYSGEGLNKDAWLAHLATTDRSLWPDWATTSKATIVPFYDRTGLIYETLGTLNTAISEEILITIIVVLIMVMHLRSGALISSMLPLAVLLCFIAMKFFKVQANIVALSGIAIAIGTIVDMGIVVCENILRHLDLAKPGESRLETVHRASSEVGSAVLTAVLTTVVSFLPVFVMTGAEGKLFKPLAFTKTFALIASILIALFVLPPAAYLLFTGKKPDKDIQYALYSLLAIVGAFICVFFSWWAGLPIVVLAIYHLVEGRLPKGGFRPGPWLAVAVCVFVVGVALTRHWEPLGPGPGFLGNLLFVGAIIGALLGFFKLFQYYYSAILSWCLAHKALFLSIPLVIIVFGGFVWLGFDAFFGWLPAPIKKTAPVSFMTHTFPGLGKEFMPPLDEGSFLYMPTTMTHASIGEALDILSKQDMAFRSIPEIDSVVGKLGRAETPLDPAPISMFETVINYKPEYLTDKDGHRIKFKYDNDKNEFIRDEFGELIPDPDGLPFRQWRDHIKKPDDIWKEIVKAGKIPGTTSAPKLQPIAARIVMLQSGMRAPMGVKIKGDSLEDIENFGLEIERYLKEVPGVEPQTVVADRIVGKPYLEIIPDRKALARYGVPIGKFNEVVEIAVGGKMITMSVEGRERFPIRVRYQRELRDTVEGLARILVPGAGGAQIPITELAEIQFVRGPMVIKSEDTFKIGYVVFDKKPDYAEVDVVEACDKYLKAKEKSGELIRPAGVEYHFAGSYENQLRAAKKLAVILPLALFVIFMLIYFQFKSFPTTILVFSGIVVAWAGGFLLIWLYGEPWFMNFSLAGISIRDLFQMHPINMSVAVWVGFLALFGIASDNGVIQSTYLDQVFRERKPKTKDAIREATIEAAERRVRPCLMTSATTILALIPVLTSTGRGSDVMVPMAIPSFGGMMVVLISIFVVPVLYCWVEEVRLRLGGGD